jgi:lysophospholipase L1-like esterase
MLRVSTSVPVPPATATPSRPMDPRRRRRFIVAAMLLPVLALALIEGALRLAGFDAPLEGSPLRFFNQQGCDEHRRDAMMVADPELFWRLRPGWTQRSGDDAVASTGFRSEFAKAKAPGVRRVVCVGDSNTYGLYVPMVSAWPSVLGRRLDFAQGPGKWEVLNLGVPGYTSFQVRRLLDIDVGQLAPDVVVAQVGGFNEWIPAVGRTDREQGRPAFWKDLRIVQFLAGGLGLRRRGIGDGSSGTGGDEARAEIAEIERHVKVRDAARGVDDLRTADYRDARRVSLPDFEDDLHAIADFGAAHGARVVFVVHPLPARTTANNPVAADYADVVRRFAASRGLAAVDGPAALRATGRSDAELFLDVCHPSATGHAALAGAVLEAVVR